MKNKLIFRLLGALSSALIIVSVFVPFVSVTGYSQSLWQTHSAVGTIYLPIMIIVFGSIGVLLFAINKKTELVYSSAGALIFFLVMQTIPIIDQGVFGTLGVGYYFLAIGTILTTIMVFICNLKNKQKVVEEVKVEEHKEDSVLSQIDRLYDNQSVQNNDMEINQLDIIQPLQTSPAAMSETSIQPLGAQMVMSQDVAVQPLQTQPVTLEDNSIPIQENINVESAKSIELAQPTIVEQPKVEENISLQNLNNISESEQVTESVIQPVNVEPQVQNQVTSEFDVPIQNINESNTVVSEFASPQEPTTEQNVSQNNPVVAEFGDTEPATNINPNPVVAEFSTLQPTTSILSQPNPVQQEESPTEVQTEAPTMETLKPLGSDVKVDVIANPSSNNKSSNLDIFG